MGEAATRLSRALARQTWSTHQHRCNIDAAEPQSEPLSDDLLPAQARTTIAEVQRLLDERVVLDSRQPTLQVRTDDVPRDSTGILLPLPPTPIQCEESYTSSPSVDAAIKIWRELVPELASGWTRHPDVVPLSLGRFFLGPADRLIYWPKLVNRALARIPISYDNIADLVAVMAMLGFKLDLKAAFRSLVIADAHARYYGACLDGIYLQCHRAPFGSTCSPAHFVLHLRKTLNRLRLETPRADQVLSAFVDDIGGGSGAGGPRPDHEPPNPSCDTCRHVIGQAAVDLTALGKRLVQALLADGWWIALAKTFFRPALRLYYTGAIADFLRGTISIDPGKAAKLRFLLSRLTLPTAELFASLPQPPDPTSPPQIRTACAAERSNIVPVGAVPLNPDHWPRPPWRILCVSAATVVPDRWSTVPRVDVHPAVPTMSAVDAIMPDPSTSAALDRDFLLIIAPSIETTYDLIASGTSRPPTIRIIIAHPDDYSHRHGDATWFNAAFALPAGLAVRTLPGRHQPPPPLPATVPDRALGTIDMTDVRPPATRSHGTLDIGDDDFASLRTIAGLLSWCSAVVKVLGAWRPAIERVWRDGTWNRPAVDAIAFLWNVAPWLPHWPRDLRRHPVRPLLVAVDAARCTWAARLTVDGTTLWVAGSLPLHAAAASTTAREAWGAACATQAAIRRRWLFDAVQVASDCSALVARGERGGVPTIESGPPMRMLASLDYQGVPVTWTWRSRYDADAPLVDAVSSSARSLVWPLRRHIASYIYDGLADGFHVDGPSVEGKAWTGRYYTLGPAEEQRRGLFMVAAREASARDDGWLGELASHTGHPDRVLFSHPAWSELSQVASLVEAGIPAVVVAPAEPGGEWWQPHLLRIARAARQRRLLPSRATVPPHTPGPHDPGYSDPGPHPMTGNRDARRLALYVCNVDFNPTATPPKGGRPVWWTPYRLTADGDVEENPGPGIGITGDIYDELVGRRPATERVSRKRLRNPTADALSRPLPHSDPFPAAPRACPASMQPANTTGITGDILPSPPSKTRAVFSGPSARPGSQRDRLALPVDARHRQPSAASTGARPSTSAVPTTALRASNPPLRAARHQPSLPTAPDSAHLPDPNPTPVTTGRPPQQLARPPRPASVARRPAAQAAMPSAATAAVGRGTATTLGSWCRDMLRIAADLPTEAAPAAPPGVAPANAHAYSSAQREQAARANKGSDKPATLPRMLLQFAEHRNVTDHPWSPAAAEGLVLDFSQTRLSKKPILGWDPVEEAATVRSDASRIAAASRRAGYQVPAYVGKAVDDWTASRGAKVKRDHSAAYPVRLRTLLDAEPPRTSPRWEVWAALVMTSLFCLRPGIAPHLYRGMFVAYDRGFILIWRHVQKRTAGDEDAVTEDEISKVNGISAARHPCLARILESANRDGRLFPTVTADRMNAFVREVVPGAPEGFDVRAHGLRTGADADADTLQMPDDLTRALFWWKRQKTDMRAYYSAINVLQMFRFSERRAEVLISPLHPGAMGAAVRKKGLTDWSTPVADSLPEPPAIDELAKAVKAVSPSFILSRRIRTTARTERARRALGCDPAPVLPSGKAPVMEGHCSKCFNNISARDRAAACVCCDELACLGCHPDLKEDFRCLAHRLVQPTRRSIAKASAAAATAAKRPGQRKK